MSRSNRTARRAAAVPVPVPVPAARPEPPTYSWAVFFRRTVPTFLIVLAVCYAVYGRVNIVFMRVESGMMLDAAQTPAGTAAMFRFAATHSYSGHYVPLFFLFEILVSKVCGISANLWRIHQMVGITFLIMALLYFFEGAAKAMTPDRLTQLWIKIGLTVPIMFSPLMIEFASWPFEMGQIIWATLTVLSLALFTRAIAHGVDGRLPLRDLSLSLACAYLSIHAFGLGATTLAGWFAVWTVLFLDACLHRAPAAYLRKLGVLAAVGLLVTATHGGLMLFLPRFGTTGPSANLSLHSYLAQTLGYTSNLLWTTLRSLGGPDGWPYSKPDFVGKDWVYGLGFILLAGGCAVGWYRSYRGTGSARLLSRVCWQVFALVSFCAYVGMVSLRIRHQGESWISYLVGPRYLWPSALLLFPFFATLASCFRLHGRGFAAALGLLVTGTCLGSNIVYQRDVVPKVWPWLTISHEQTWHELAATADDLQRAHLPMPNLSLHLLGYENYPMVRQYEPLLRKLAGIKPGEPFAWIASNDISAALWANMKGHSPALTRLSQRVFAEQDDMAREADAELAEEQKRATGVSLVTPEALKDVTLAHVKDQPNLGVDLSVNGIARKSIWIDAPTALTYHHLVLGAHPALHVYVAIHPLIYTEATSDGATFQVSVNVDGQTRQLADVYINPIAHPELRKWTPLDVDLSQFAGKTVDLTLSNSPGPANNDYADWCLWGDPRLSD